MYLTFSIHFDFSINKNNYFQHHRFFNINGKVNSAHIQLLTYTNDQPTLKYCLKLLPTHLNIFPGPKAFYCLLFPVQSSYHPSMPTIFFHVSNFYCQYQIFVTIVINGPKVSLIWFPFRERYLSISFHFHSKEQLDWNKPQ